MENKRINSRLNARPSYGYLILIRRAVQTLYTLAGFCNVGMNIISGHGRLWMHLRLCCTTATSQAVINV